VRNASWDGQYFHYAGEGQRGDQDFVRGNKAILLAEAEGRDLCGFLGATGTVRYAGRFRLETDRRFYTTLAPETGGGPMRQVIMFRLLPIAAETKALLPNVNLRAVLTTAYRPPENGVDDMVTPRFESERGSPASGHARLHWWYARQVADKLLQPLSPGPTDPDFDVAYRAPGRTATLAVVDDPDELRPLKKRLVHHIERLNEAREHLTEEFRALTRTVVLHRPPDDPRIVEGLASRGVRLVWP
jgi:hypothetical protein